MTTDADAGGGGPRKPAPLVIGDKNQGCRHCGSVTMTTVETTRAVYTVYRRSLECCTGAVLDRIAARNAELGTLRTKARVAETPDVRKAVLTALEDLDRLRPEALRRAWRP